MSNFEFSANGEIKLNQRQVGYIDGDVIYSGGNGTYGGRQVGYIDGDVIYSGGNGRYGGRQVGYVSGNTIYSGGSGLYGGQQLGAAQMPHPRWNAAAYFLLT